jgi:DNA topoisomerase-3
MLYDLTSLQREANTRFGFSARRTLGAAQRLYEEHKALTYPRTNSRYLTTDMAPEIKPIAELLGARPNTEAAAEYVTGLDVLPLARVIDDSKVTDHHAIIPTRAEHPVDKMDDDDHRIYDLVVRRFLAAFHPEAVLENTRVETTVAGHVFRTRGKVLLVPGWRGVYLAAADPSRAPIARRRGRHGRPAAAAARAGRALAHARDRVSSPRRPSRRAATPTHRCSERWRRPASSSTTRSCARR